ncbi:hypothetical protein BO94DRAFT_172687 [Aspergillus sclerotioniger CBS 115572]|uniref:Uncharacterized protein n=1 Tax=Aspergillus sclerotioniger CBS 115572 TaxID=1450535 RepID=A0A317VYP1_9EURO|nr:hypothetical protein BO94DRAFT_172687 [Aspergillus sclerotioniger CBS 115572]PWY79486.1 hypothetical protein BO94DRAFT_172687 [Aspergillus sclerotioniger CBS 115572]
MAGIDRVKEGSYDAFGWWSTAWLWPATHSHELFLSTWISPSPLSLILFFFFSFLFFCFLFLSGCVSILSACLSPVCETLQSATTPGSRVTLETSDEFRASSRHRIAGLQSPSGGDPRWKAVEKKKTNDDGSETSNQPTLDWGPRRILQPHPDRHRPITGDTLSGLLDGARWARTTNF